MSRLVLFVEGEGDVEAAPVLINRLALDIVPDEHRGTVFVDPDPFRIHGVDQLTGRRADNWSRWLQAAMKRPRGSGVLLLLDADVLEDRSGCVCSAACELAEAARQVGAGKTFSVAVVFFRKEYESLFIASYQSLPGCRSGVALPPNVEVGPRGAKGWLHRNLDGGYSETEDQPRLTRELDFATLRTKRIRCFTRLEFAVRHLYAAIANGTPIVSPCRP